MFSKERLIMVLILVLLGMMLWGWGIALASPQTVIAETTIIWKALQGMSFIWEAFAGRTHSFQHLWSG